MTEHDNRPPHQRLETFATKHLVAILKDLSGGSVGFDPWRDARTASKEACAAYIHAAFSGDELVDKPLEWLKAQLAIHFAQAD